MFAEDKLYHYKSTVIGVKDGDTIVCDIDLGFGLHKKGVVCRFKDYNAPEARGKEKVFGKLATEKLKIILPEGKDIILHTTKAGSFGRWLIEIYLMEQKTWLIPQLINEGWGVFWSGKGKRPKFDLNATYPLTDITPMIVR